MGRLFPAGIQLLFVEQIAGEAHYVIVAPKQQQKVFILHNFRQLLVVDCLPVVLAEENGAGKVLGIVVVQTF